MTGGSYVTEWFGHVVWPPSEVDKSPEAVQNQNQELCPFLSSATAGATPCIKKKKDSAGIEFRTGFCTQSSTANGPREDWLACPARVFDQPFTLICEAVANIYGDAPGGLAVFPITRFGDQDVKDRIAAMDTSGERIFAFASLPTALGGEIDIPETAGSPGNKVDVTIFEVLGVDIDDTPDLGRFAIFEIQTADFHGSPLHAVAALRALGPPTASDGYHDAIAANPLALSTKLEGPNKANIFKRTIYQMILKIQMAKDAHCAGFCVVLPEPVWRSWARHLGDPQLVPDPKLPGVLRLTAPNLPTLAASGAGAPLVEPEPAWIIVFEIDRASSMSPKPLKVTRRIATDSAALIHFAFDAAPEAAIASGAIIKFEEAFRRRLEVYW